jgi:acyl carrier protein
MLCEVENEVEMDNKTQIRKILSECLDYTIGPDEITRDLSITNDLQVDSIIYIQFVVMIEEYFHIEIPDDKLEFSIYANYGDIESMIVDLIKQNSADESR